MKLFHVVLKWSGKLLIKLNCVFKDPENGQITISASGIFGIVLGAAVAIALLIFGIWWSKFRGIIYPVGHDNSVELRPLNQPSDPDDSEAQTQSPTEESQASTQSQAEESQAPTQPAAEDSQAPTQSQSLEPQGQPQSDAENPFELEG